MQTEQFPLVSITSSSSGTIFPVNPPLKLYRDSNVTFDLSDVSLSYNKSESVLHLSLNFIQIQTLTISMIQMEMMQHSMLREQELLV